MELPYPKHKLSINSVFFINIEAYNEKIAAP